MQQINKKYYVYSIINLTIRFSSTLLINFLNLSINSFSLLSIIKLYNSDFCIFNLLYK